MLSKFGTILWYLNLCTVSMIFYFIALLIRILTFPFDRKRLVVLQQFTCFWGALETWLMPNWRIKIIYRNKIRHGATYIVVSNHQSLLDILVGFNLFFHFKFVSKDLIFKLPFIGWNMTLNNYVKLIRGDKDSVAKMMNHCEQHLSDGNSVYFYPEGTRSVDGKIKNFKPGAFILAKKMKVPILVIVLSGTTNAVPKKSLFFHGKHKIRIKVTGEIPYNDFKDLSVEETSNLVREKMIKELDILNEEMGIS